MLENPSARQIRCAYFSRVIPQMPETPSRRILASRPPNEIRTQQWAVARHRVAHISCTAWDSGAFSGGCAHRFVETGVVSVSADRRPSARTLFGSSCI
jgi:hypothetical protein